MQSSKVSFKNMMVAPHHLAAKTGSDILKEGGNAIEAMIASAAMISVVYPHMNSMGGAVSYTHLTLPTMELV